MSPPSDPESIKQRSGIYAVVNLDGAPLSPDHAGKLGLSPSNVHTQVAAAATDGQSDRFCHRFEDQGGMTLLSGFLSDPAAMAARLGLSTNAPLAMIARAAWARHGGDMPGQLLGEWSFLHWTREHGCTVMLSAARRDPLYYAVAGRRLSVASDIFALARLPWISRELDECAMLATVGNAPIKQALAARTMFRQITALPPGGSATINPAGGIDTVQCHVLTPQPVSTHDVREAVHMYRETLLTVLRERMAGAAHCTDLLSGGLDSSLLAWAAAEVRAPQQELSAITIVAPDGSGVTDERDYAALVTRHLGITPYHVSADTDLNQFRPSDHILASQNGIPLVGRHCTTESIQRKVKAVGADMVFNGTWGETSATSRHYTIPLRNRMGRAWREVKTRWAGHAVANPAEPNFHARLAAHRRQAIDAPLRKALEDARATRPRQERQASDTIGYLPAAYKCLHHPNEFYAGAARMEFIFRDLRLLRLFASFPRDMLIRDAADRGIARAMLAGGLPDAVRLRVNKGQAFPDNHQRMQREAEAARQRIPMFRQAQLDDWLDLDWLDQQLALVAANGPANELHSVRVQTTAITAEFLLWWQGNS